MQFLSLEPFVPSGADFEASKQLSQDLGFTLTWDGGDYVGFGSGSCKFILQEYDHREFAENFMLSVGVSDAAPSPTSHKPKRARQYNPPRFSLSGIYWLSLHHD
jgi:hypothetical protein